MVTEVHGRIVAKRPADRRQVRVIESQPGHARGIVEAKRICIWNKPRSDPSPRRNLIHTSLLAGLGRRRGIARRICRCLRCRHCMSGRPRRRSSFGPHLRAGHGANQNPCQCRCEKVEFRDHALAPTKSDALTVAAVAAINTPDMRISPQPAVLSTLHLPALLWVGFIEAALVRGGQRFVSSHVTQVVL